MRATIDLTTCAGYAICIGLAPEVFDLNESGQAEVRPEDCDEFSSAVREAAKCCPTRAILIEE